MCNSRYVEIVKEAKVKIKEKFKEIILQNGNSELIEKEKENHNGIEKLQRKKDARKELF